MAMEKTFDAREAEGRLYEAWEKAGCFRAGANARPGASSFCIMIPPPNVTGALHLGHAFNNTLQDILTRWHRMRGFDTLWQPGQDHAGIATQLQVEKKLLSEEGKRRTDLTREDFLARVWDWKAASGDTIITQLKRLGSSCDWSRNAFTMSGAPNAPTGNEGNFHDAVIKVFVDMYHKGLIHRGKRLVNWDPHFETAISDLEVENIEVDGNMWHFRYPLAGGETYRYIEKDAEGVVIVDEIRDYIAIATTRPETMLGDGAVAVHPGDTRYAPIVGKLCEIPVGPKQHRRLIPIITDDYPDPDFGSGAVKITGAHDANDYGVAKRGGIPMYRLMDTRAHMRADGAPYDQAAARAQEIANGAEFTEGEVDALNLVPDHLRGLDRLEARAKVVAEITAEGLAVMTRADDPRLGGKLAADADPAAPVPLVEAKKIMQPFGDRSGVVIEPMLTDQWFVDTAQIVGPALDAVRDGRVTILPESGEKTYFHWLENIEPWCISRQLWWGHRIPVWYGTEFEKFVPEPGEDPSDFEFLPVAGSGPADVATHGNEKVVCAASTESAISEFKRYAEAIAGEEVLVRESGSGTGGIGVPQRDETGKLIYEINHDPDVLDTWFSSGLWPIGTLGWPEQTEELKKYFPTSVLITGQDILFFWVARMMMMQLAVVDDVPFRTVYLHQLVRDAKGQKMSKTRGNVIDPLEVIDEFGADALRFTMAQMAAIGGVLKISTDRIKGYRNFTTKLWNAHRFAEMNGVFEGPAPALSDLQPQEALNRWILSETARVREEVDAALDAYRFNDAANALYAFVWGKVCDWYVEFSKPLLMDGSDAQIAETRATMAFVLDQCLILLHPFTPFITEELWQVTRPRAKMLAVTDWPEHAAADLADPQAEAEIGRAIALIEGIRSARAQMNVPAGLYVPVLQIEADAMMRAAWERNAALIKRLARIESLDTADSPPRGAITVAVTGGAFAIPLAEIIDVTAEKARIDRALDKMRKEIAGLEKRLDNPAYLASAPAEVVEDSREALGQRREEAAQLSAALDRLAEID